LLINIEPTKTNKHSWDVDYANTPNAFFPVHNTSLTKQIEVHQMSFEDYVNNPLWRILVDTVHALSMFPHHKAYVRDVLLIEQPQMSAEDLVAKLSISLGESLVILYELEASKPGS
jgi:hypothetical protein